MTLSEEVIRIYGKRWSIEVFFKICKSYLNLSKEFRCLSYDAMVAHTAIVLVRYMILAVECRDREDARTLGKIFYLAYDELQDIQFAEALAIILEILKETLQETLFLTDEQGRQFIEAFILKLPEYLSKKLV